MDIGANKHRPAPEPIVARYLPRLLLNNLNLGIVRSYIYELIDTYNRGSADAESNFGLVRYDGTEKPSYRAVQNFMRIFNDITCADFPRTLKVTATGDTQDVKILAFKKCDGSLLIAIWLGITGWDPDQRVLLNVGASRPLMLNFSGLTVTQINSFNDTGAVERVNPNPPSDTQALIVTDSLTVLELR
jgi:hypothetical protein